MDEKKQEQLTGHFILPEPPTPPETPVQPEEGFVPYCGEQAGKQSRSFVKFTVLLILGLLVAAGVIVIIFGRTFNFYQTVIGSLSFDYRDGEMAGDPIEDEYESYAALLADQCRGKQLNATIVHYQFDDQRNLDSVVTKYEYAYNVNEVRADIKRGTAKWYGAKEQTVRRTNVNGYEILKGNEWQSTPDAYIPPLYTYLFEVGETESRKFDWYASLDSVVNGKLYTCEIWLLTDNSGSETVYLTLYRYYQGDRLCGVRVLNNIDTSTQVYDVQSYTIS